MDDVFGGFIHCPSEVRANHFRAYLCAKGKELTLLFNMHINKTPMAAQQQVILGSLWDAVQRLVKTALNKRQKYLKRISNITDADCASVINILRLHGNLNYAAAVAPYGRPFLASLTNAACGRTLDEQVVITEEVGLCFRIWRSIFTKNRGFSFNFLTDALPRCNNDIFRGFFLFPTIYGQAFLLNCRHEQFIQRY